MPKPLNIRKARPLISSLFRDSRLSFSELRGGLKAVYFNEELEPTFWAKTWEEILESAQEKRFNQTHQ